MSESLYSVNCPSALLLTRRDQTWLARLQCCHWLLLAYPIFLHLVSRTRSADEALVVDESAKYQVALTVLYGIYVACLVMRCPLSWTQVSGPSWAQLRIINSPSQPIEGRSPSTTLKLRSKCRSWSDALNFPRHAACFVVPAFFGYGVLGLPIVETFVTPHPSAQSMLDESCLRGSQAGGVTQSLGGGGR